ncbi:ABC transporter ATP-binding protein [Oerskovia sp. Sa1BUA8]|uniref:ABC transporter ATP-binding protein n=1 Tax=Oerskovia douganii TaxID=2762210 RepID=A0A9D5YYE2_9CELL|nr:ABC transporter ATP-binding protein [Oerskovia douganii]MBE7700538.1 ABC transporter ATP-binding protein [Oerskovia douganii]
MTDDPPVHPPTAGPRRTSALRAVLAARASRWTDLAQLLPQAGRPLVAAAALLNVLLGLLPLAFIVLVGYVLYLVPQVAASPGADGGSGQAGWSDLLTALGLAVGVFVVQQVLAPFQAGVTEVIARRVDEHCIDRLMTAALHDAPLDALQQPEALDLLAEARAAFARQARPPGDAAAALLSLLARYVQLVGAVVLVGIVVSPLAGIVIGATALAIRFGVRGTLGKFADMWDSLAGSRRKVFYLRDLATGSRAAKEIRLLGLLPWVRARLRSDTMAAYEPAWAGSRKLQFWPMIGLSGVGLVGGAVVLVLVADAAASGRLNLFELGVALQAVLIPMRFGVYFPEADVQTQFGLHSYHALRTFERQIASARPVRSAAPVPVRRPEQGIRFEGVRFRYSDDTPWVLDGLDLELGAGQSTAIVGLNGAGKTTLVKLLARLYEPTEGRILVDGVDLRELDTQDWQRQLALIFQDYVRYELSAAENIGLGAPALLDDREAIEAAARKAGALDVLSGLPQGLDTTLSRRYPGGRDLSGGQWQRVALARALLAIRGGSSVLVLDEPTAQLDVRAEAEFFDRFLATTENITSVVISHRFSTVRHADRIAVIEHGRVIECGDHVELVALGGRYADLFELQAQRFRDTAAVGAVPGPHAAPQGEPDPAADAAEPVPAAQKENAS